MKRIAFIIMVACMPLMAMSQGVITRPGKKPTKTDTQQPARQQHSSSSNRRPSRPSAYTVSGTINGHDYVDLGLSVKWATCNVGAASPSDYGSYFAWGDTSAKAEYTEANSITYKKNMGDIAGNPQYDAARTNWGSTWRLPTKAECEELANKCTWTWTTQGGHNGYRVTSKTNRNSIFVPAAGYRYGTSLYVAGENGYTGALRLTRALQRTPTSSTSIPPTTSWTGTAATAGVRFAPFQNKSEAYSIHLII